jgi:GrpB-like predicted nucleotidyltransferase (UPF0157 family)
VSPTVLRTRGYRFYFFSKEENQPHVHVATHGNEAKFWLSPRVTLATNQGLRRNELSVARRLIEGHLDEILAKWEEHLSS